jgi:uncharacterized protein (DUF697 family)
MKKDKGVALLDWAYKTALNGIPMVSEPLNDFVNGYIEKYGRTEKAIDRMVAAQKMKCATTGFLTGLGGLITLPVTLPTDLASSLYMQVRMIVSIAMLRGYKVNDDEVKSLVFLCLVGNAVGDVLKNAGIKGVQQFAAKKLLPLLTKELVVKINQTVGFKLLAKGGSKGLVNAGKVIPVVGGIVGCVWNYSEVHIYAKLAKKMFNENFQAE